MPLILRRAAVLLVALLLAGVVVQIPILPLDEGRSLSSIAEVAARLLGEPPERIGYDDVAGFLTLRKIATAAVFSLVAAFVWGLWRGDASHTRLVAIPLLSAQTAAVVRIVFATGLLWAFMSTGPVEPAFPVALHRNAGLLADWPWLEALAAHDRAAIWIHRARLGAAVVFGLGLYARLAAVMLAALTTLHTLVLLQRQSAHDWGLPVVTLWLLTLVPWGDALSADAIWRRLRGRPQPARTPAEYGLAVWIPGFALGVALLAAAFAKIDSGGVAWITGGAVRYHFVTDAVQAPVDWGLRIAGNLPLARLASLGAVMLEALFLLNIFVSRWQARLAFGLAGAALLLGFLLFQGVLWPMWWVLLLAFVPWHEITGAVRKHLPRQADRAPNRPPAERRGWLKPWQIAVLAAFALQQVVFSGIRLEIEPLASDYAMYASTYRSTQEFDEYLAAKRRTFRLEAAAGAPAVDVAERLADLPGARDTISLTLDELRRLSEPAPGTRAALRAVIDAYERHYHEPMPPLHVRADEPRFDWAHGRFAAPGEFDYGIVDFATIADR